MADREEDPQRLKKIAAAAYDYENDPRWADYWSNILIPPHMASRSDVREHFKRKFYQRFIDPELVVEAMSTGSSSSSSSSSSAASEQPRARNSGHLGHQQLQAQLQLQLRLPCVGIDKPYNFLSMLG